MLGLASNITKTAEGYPQYRTRTSCTFAAGDEDRVQVSNHADLQVNGSDFSFSGWVKVTVDATSVDNEDGYAIIQAGKFGSADSESGAYQQGRGFYCYYRDNAGDDEKFTFNIANASSNTTAHEGDNVTHNTWYHVVGTYDYSETTSRLYVNGSEVSAGPKTNQNEPDQFTDTVHIGGSSTNYINAKQCEVIFWKGTILSPAQAAGLYNNGRPRHGLSCERDTIKGYWRLNADDDTGSNNVIDYSGNGRHGTTSGLASGDFDTTDVPG
jgi:hypothetical protein